MLPLPRWGPHGPERFGDHAGLRRLPQPAGGGREEAEGAERPGYYRADDAGDHDAGGAGAGEGVERPGPREQGNEGPRMRAVGGRWSEGGPSVSFLVPVFLFPRSPG